MFLPCPALLCNATVAPLLPLPHPPNAACWCPHQFSFISCHCSVHCNSCCNTATTQPFPLTLNCLFVMLSVGTWYCSLLPVNYLILLISANNSCYNAVSIKHCWPCITMVVQFPITAAPNNQLIYTWIVVSIVVCCVICYCHQWWLCIVFAGNTLAIINWFGKNAYIIIGKQCM